MPRSPHVAAKERGAPMDHVEFIVLSWVLTLGALAVYARRTARLARKLDPLVDPKDKPWT